MGTKLYLLRKDGTINVDRLKADLSDHAAREAARNASIKKINANAAATEWEYAEVNRRVSKLSGASGSGVFLECGNDGRVEGCIRFKASGHITPARALAILDAIESTQGE